MSRASPAKPLAAIVFEESEKANRILADFAADRARAGTRIGGIIQISANMTECQETHALDLETGRRLPLLQNLGVHSQSCRVDVTAIAEAASIITGAILREPELLFINRYGKLEAEGKGLFAEIGAAALSNIPTLVGVSIHHVAHWRAFTMDLAQELACSRAALDEWWHEIALATPRVQAQSLSAPEP